jgi:uncharacterized delta-60 repeat protein
MGRLAAIALVLLALAPLRAAAGGPDPAFGHGGSASFAPQRFSGGAGVAVDAQGRVLVGATLDDGSLLHTHAAVLRLLPDGSLDPSFGSGGVATVPPPAPYMTSRAYAIALDSQGRVLIAGAVDDDIPAATRLLADGTLDPGFASGGILVAKGAYEGLPGGWYSVALSGSRIVLAGAVDGGPPFGTRLGRIAVLAQLGDNGLPDATFAGGGFLELPVAGVTFASTHAIAIDHRGRIVLGFWRATTVAFPGDVAAAVARVTAAGSLDGSFGSGGFAVLGPLQGRAPSVSVTGTGDIVALGGWTARTGTGIAIAARLRPSGRLDTSFGENGELAAAGAAPSAGVLDCQGDLLTSSPAGVQRFGPDGRLDRTFRTAAVPQVAVGATTAAAAYDSLGLTSSGAVVLAGTAADGPTTIGGTSQVGNNAIAVARVQAACPIADSGRPAVTLTCTAGCRRVNGTALDDPLGHGIRRVLLGIERLTGTRCEAWNGRRFTALPCGRAAALLIPAAPTRGAFRTLPLGPGHFVVRAVAVDRDGNRSQLAVRRVSR